MPDTHGRPGRYVMDHIMETVLKMIDAAQRFCKNCQNFICSCTHEESKP